MSAGSILSQAFAFLHGVIYYVPIKNQKPALTKEVSKIKNFDSGKDIELNKQRYHPVTDIMLPVPALSAANFNLHRLLIFIRAVGCPASAGCRKLCRSGIRVAIARAAA